MHLAYQGVLLIYQIRMLMTNQICFHKECGRLYKKILQQLAGYETTSTDEKTLIEWGFRIFTRAWFSILKELDSYQFAGQQEEIIFYKTLKPKFTGHIDYFTLLYKSFLFQQGHEPGEIEYWKNELADCTGFLLKHSAFCRYYKEGDTGMDHIYFVQKNNQEPLIFGINENKCSVVTSYSNLLSRVISITKYRHYLQKKIHVLTNANYDTRNIIL